MVELKRGAVRKFIGNKYVFGQVMPSERAKYLQSEINRLNIIIRVQNAIGIRYKAIKKELEYLLSTIRDENKFSREKQTVYTEGRHVNERVWDIGVDLDLKKEIAMFEQRLHSILGEIRWIEGMDIKIEEGEAAEMSDEELKDAMERIEVELKKLRDILGKFDRIWKRIKALERGKKGVVGIAKDCEEFEKEIENDLAKIYKTENKKRIDNIRKELNSLKKINDELKKLVGEEFILEQGERKILEMLVRGLRRDKQIVEQLTQVYPEFQFHPHLLSQYSHFETDLNEEEQKVIVYQITPLMARLYQLTYKLKEVIEDEEKKIVEFRGDVTKVKRVTRKSKHLTNKDIDLARSLWGKFKEIYSIIKDKEIPLAEYISQVEDKIKDADNKLEELEKKREGVVSKVEEEVK